uniref:C2H2-type domain-containing protein n=1 Tax=Macrostomum lignano TaxID=282301 RepID=A0A1I8JL48_9PLAT
TDTATPMSEALAPAAPRTVVLDPDPMSEISRRAERLRSEAADAGAVLYPCGFCRKVFKFKYEYERHAKIHSGDRPWSCNQCYKTFSRKDNMRAHMKIHTGELVRHECGVCGKSYGRKYDLQAGPPPKSRVGFTNPTRISNWQVHERVHSGERPFQCASCGRSFISTSRLRAHQLIHCKNIYLPRHVRNKGSLHQQRQQQLCLLPPALPPPQTPQPSSTPSLSSLASPLPSSLPPTAGE